MLLGWSTGHRRIVVVAQSAADDVQPRQRATARRTADAIRTARSTL
jgi:hypothetical protein